MIRRIIKSTSPNHQKKGESINKPKNKHYCRRRGEKESGGDFILLILTKEELINPREIKSLIKVAKIFGAKNLKIVTWDLEKEMVVKGAKIICRPFYKWVMKEIISD